MPLLFPEPEYLHLQVTKLSFNGKDYDLSNSFGRGMGGAMCANGPMGINGPVPVLMVRAAAGRGGRW
jgi:hypothetical protein